MVRNIDELKKAYQLARIIGFAMVGSIFVYAGIVEFVRSNIILTSVAAHDSNLEIVRYLFLGFVVMNLLSIRFINKFLLGSRPVVRGGQNQPMPAQVLIRKLLVSSIITYALCESIAICGLGLFLFTHKASDFYIFAGFSLFFFAIYFPRYIQWGEWFRDKALSSKLTNQD